MGENVILYEHGCPRCKVLKSKLDQKGIQYKNISDIEVMKAKGFTEAPKLEIDGVIYDFKEATEWINKE
jgi:glutaredoxin